MSSCLSGAAAYSFELEMMKSPPSRAVSRNTPSPSSTISESHSPPLAISTRKPRTRRKRPNQTYDEAAALLSTAYPNIFSSKKNNPSNTLFFGIKYLLSDYVEASELLLPFESIEETDILFNPATQTKQDHFVEHKEVNTGGKNDDSEVTRFGTFNDFDAESILDEEIEEGIDSIMGNIESNDGENRGNEESGFSGRNYQSAGEVMTNPWYGSSMGFGFAGKFQPGLGLKNSLRGDDDVDWCRFPTVEFEQISPRIEAVATAAADVSQSGAVDSSKKKKKKVAPPSPSPPAAELKSFENSKLKPEQRVSLSLNLDYNGVLGAWSDKASPFSDEIMGLEVAGIDVHARLGEIDLFGENGVREASVLRYKEKRKNRLFSNSKRIRYQVRKLNADQRPRMKGRFVRRTNVRNLSGLRL
uniref:Protein CHLOROPLAST IMPORT APPARATUS 2 n=1 Tax=Noccaea caerulescens TaxID=107243 RepID=A0A1J3ELL9_NOCCA